jgi:type I restriction enzyme S subunit
MSGSIGDTGSLGNFAFVNAEHLPAQLNQRVGRFLVRHVKLDARFLRLLVQSKVLGEQILQFVTGTAQFNISAQQVESVVIAVPPIKEQVDAVESIRDQDARFDRLISSYTRQLALLAEYRASLIHECVTGQRAVSTKEKSA